MSQLLESFQEAGRNMQLRELSKESELEKFGVEYGTETIEELKQLVEESPSGDSKIIFAGYQGCGKSTLLAKFGRQMADKYFVVFFSISNLIDTSVPLKQVDILSAITAGLIKEAKKQKIEIQASVKNKFYQWFAQHTKIKIEDIKAEASTGIDLIKIITGMLRLSTINRKQTKQEITSKVSDLIEVINEIADVVRDASQKEILIVIDDLDKEKLEIIEPIYQSELKVNFRVIFTIPFSALRELSLISHVRTKTNYKIVQMPISKFFKKGENRSSNALPLSDSTDMFAEIIYQRISRELIEPETAKKIIIYSGGVLRELLKITNECCRICQKLIRRKPDDLEIKINAEVLEEAITNLRLEFETAIGAADYEILQKTYQNFEPDDPKEDKFLDLLHGLYVLVYHNGELWYDVHPIVTELLERKGKL